MTLAKAIRAQTVTSAISIFFKVLLCNWIHPHNKTYPVLSILCGLVPLHFGVEQNKVCGIGPAIFI